MRLRNEEDEAGSSGAPEMDGRMVAVVERMFERCYNDQGVNWVGWLRRHGENNSESQSKSSAERMRFFETC